METDETSKGDELNISDEGGEGSGEFF